MDRHETGNADALVARVTRAMADGREGAFGELYDHVCERLYRMLLVQTRGDENVAREVLQAVLLKLARYVPVCESEARLWAWLKQCSRSAHVDWIRRERKHQAEPIEVAEFAPPAFIEQRSEDEELIELLEQSVCELEEEEREIIRMSYSEGMAQREIAAKEGTTVKGVESKLARIRRKLRTALLEKLKEYAVF